MHNDDDVEFDLAKAEANRRKHGIDFDHAEQALRDPFAITKQQLGVAGEARFITLGMDAKERLLVVVHAMRGTRVRLISARRATGKEARQYHEEGI